MSGPDQATTPTPTPHLAPALTAVILGLVMLGALEAYGRSLERRSLAGIAASEAVLDTNGALYRFKNQGSALQRAAVEADGLLPLYGSSELNLLRAYNRPFLPTNLFRDRPGGFTILPVGKEAATSLIIQQKLAAVGPALRGRKVIISLSPFWFYDGLTAWAGGYAGNFSPLHAGEVAFNPRLSLELRRDAARRMLQYPATLADRPLLKFALENLADGSPLALAGYDAALPLGMLNNAILRYQDHWNVVRYLWTHPAPKVAANPPADARRMDWTAWEQKARDTYKAQSNTNDLGLDNKRWRLFFRKELELATGTRTDEEFLRSLRDHQEWVDLELLLRTLDECGARPMLLSMPMHGGWFDRLGVSYAARTAYYRKLREAADRHGAPLVDFAEYDGDQTFCFDYRGHLSPNGWIHYNRAFDDFYHDTLPPRPTIPVAPAAGATGKKPGEINEFKKS